MSDDIRDKLFNLLDIINNNKKVKRMKQLKTEIYESDDLKKLLNDFHDLSDDEYSDKYIQLKEKILNNKIITEYKVLENELYFTVLEINKMLNGLIDKRKCK